jgi:hypothetical protein
MSFILFTVMFCLHHYLNQGCFLVYSPLLTSTGSLLNDTMISGSIDSLPNKSWSFHYFDVILMWSTARSQLWFQNRLRMCVSWWKHTIVAFINQSKLIVVYFNLFSNFFPAADDNFETLGHHWVNSDAERFCWKFSQSLYKNQNHSI